MLTYPHTPTPDRTEVPTQTGTRLHIISQEAKGLWHRLSWPNFPSNKDH